uniref:ORF45b n=1 Tax=Pinus thunbergii TaxID=3350 RepID=Q32929_PINTH|nr:ORF45b [Pinus thunbergii]BAA04313.1 ORF45b [Pinus thunbergii]
MVFFPSYFFGSTRDLLNIYENKSLVIVSIRDPIARSEVSGGIGRN